MSPERIQKMNTNCRYLLIIAGMISFVSGMFSTSMMSDTQLTSALSKATRYRPEIDGIRAFAVIAVIINHFNKDILPGGYLGVDIFFVISGYVITSSLYSRPSVNFKDFISSFYERRIKRLIPALSVFVLITSIVICFFDPSPRISLRTGLTSLFGLSNIYLFNRSTDYFAESTELNVFTHTWSLGVEEQFYILFPFLIWYSGYGRQASNGARNLFLVIGAITVSSCIGFIYLYSTNQPAAYFLMPSRFWEMAAGCLIFISFQKRTTIEIFLEKVPPLLVLALIVGVMLLPMYSVPASTIALVLLSSLLIGCLKKHALGFKVFTNPKVVYVGLISYSLYLWHWGVLSISRWTIGIHWWTTPFQIALMFGLAVASYRLIETPILRHNLIRKRWKIFAVGGGVLLFTAGSLTFIRKSPILGSNLFLSSNENLRSTWWRDRDGNYIDNCHLEMRFYAYKLKECLGKPRMLGGQGIAFVIGDSHARNYLSAVREALPTKEIRYMTIGHGCSFLPKDDITKDVDEKVSCSQYVKQVSLFISKDSRPGDLVFVGRSLLNEDVLSTKRLNAYFSHIKTFAEALKSKTIPVIVFDSTSPPGGDPRLCAKEIWRPYINKSNCEKPLDQAASAYLRFDELAMSLSKNSENLYYAPLRLGLCVDGICGQYTRKGTPIWHDIGHITEQSSMELGNLLREKLFLVGIINSNQKNNLD